MGTQLPIPFPDGGDFPPPKRHKKVDDIIDVLFQCLPAASGKIILQRLEKRGIHITYNYLMNVISDLRRNCIEYQWTIPHVKSGIPTGENKFFHILVTKDKVFYSDPEFRGHLADGSESMLTRIQTESSHQGSMLKAASEAQYGSRFLKEVFSDMSEECLALSKKAGRVLRTMKAGNGTNGH
jgi:hypothetical protein